MLQSLHHLETVLRKIMSENASGKEALCWESLQSDF